MIPSKTATKSEMIWSTSSSPARTVITSELGFVYFLLRMLVRKTVNVCGLMSEIAFQDIDLEALTSNA